MPLDHYIPQVYLRNFYSPILVDRMYATRKSDLKSFTPNSKSVCRVADGNTNLYLREDRAIEEFLKEIEPKYNMALMKLTENKIDSQCIYTIAGFVAYIITCSPTGMRIFSKPLTSMVETLALDAEKRGLIALPPDELAGTSLAEILKNGDIEITVDRKYPQALGINSIFQHIAAFGNFKWDVLLNGFDQNPFFSSDFPIAIEETEDWRIVNRIVSLAPHLAVRIRPDLSVDRKHADFSFANFGYLMRHVSHKELVEINRLLVQCAEDAVFYRDDLSWVLPFIAKNRNFRIEMMIHRRRVHNGSFVISTQRVVPYRASRQSDA